MKSPKRNEPAKRVWRISPNAPQGEWVDPRAPAAARPESAAGGELPEVSTGGWIVSSFDLLRGADVDTSGDTVPDDLFDELFPSHKPADETGNDSR